MDSSWLHNSSVWKKKTSRQLKDVYLLVWRSGFFVPVASLKGHCDVTQPGYPEWWGSQGWSTDPPSVDFRVNVRKKWRHRYTVLWAPCSLLIWLAQMWFTRQDESVASISFLQYSLAIVSCNQTLDEYCMMKLEPLLLGRTNTLPCSIIDAESGSGSHLLVEMKKPSKNACLVVRKSWVQAVPGPSPWTQLFPSCAVWGQVGDQSTILDSPRPWAGIKPFWFLGHVWPHAHPRQIRLSTLPRHDTFRDKQCAECIRELIWDFAQTGEKLGTAYQNNNLRCLEGDLCQGLTNTFRKGTASKCYGLCRPHRLSLNNS